MRTGTSDKVECMEEGIVGKKLSFEDMGELIQVSDAKYGIIEP